jgi:hypothetical protein
VALHAGFAASISLSQELLQLLTRMVYNANLFSHNLRFPFPPVAVDLYLSPPTLLLDHVFGNVLVIDLFAWGSVTVTPPGNPAESRRATLEARATVPVAAGLENDAEPGEEPNPVFKLSLVSDQATLVSHQFTSYSGGPWSPAAAAFLESPAVHDLLETALKLQLGAMGDAIPPISASMLGGMGLDPTATVVTRAVTGALVLGVDGETPQGRTAGYAGFLANNAIGNDIGVWIHRDAVSPVYATIRAILETRIAEQGGTLDSFELGVEDGYFAISGHASHPQGAGNFSLEAVPRIGAPGFEGLFFFELRNLQLALDSSGLGGMLKQFLIFVFASIIGGWIQRAMARLRAVFLANNSTRADLTQTLTIPGIVRPAITSRLTEFGCYYDGVHTVTRLTADFWPGRLTGPSFMLVEEALARSTRYRFELPADIHADDPDLRIAWTLRRPDTNEILLSNDAPALGNVALVFDGSFVPFEVIPELSIDCRVYRTRGSEVFEIFHGAQKLLIHEYVDRSHPYVRWEHDVLIRMVRVEPNDSRTELGLARFHRRSAIHQTSISRRCRMLRHYSLTEIHPPAPAGEYPLIYLDSLPFPVSEILQNRDQLCDYCFFGGPDKDVPLIP